MALSGLAAFHLAKIRHVWIIELENTSFSTGFGHPSSDPELARVLVSKGALLRDYYGIGHDSLDNYIAEISGQAPNFQTGQDCAYFSKFLQFGGENFDKWTKYGQLSGDGCVYPEYVRNAASQLTAHHLSWKSYNQQMGNDPAVTLKPLTADLAHVSSTPAYSWITPDTCADGHDTPRCQDGARGGLNQVDKFLASYVPRIMASPAYKASGLIVITFDESGDDTDATACCGEKDSLGFTDPSHPNVNEPGLYGPGGRVGAVALSPFIKPGTESSVAYNHYSLLKTVEEIFGLPLLGDARQPQVRAFGTDVFTG
jgi:phosphatidylinositol-3-phosphatase